MTNIVVNGKGGIRVEIILHSINEAGNELITFLVDHPRIVHAEELKHRQFSYSAASSRAIPSAKMAEQLTGMPVSFGKNQSGMQAGEEHNALVKAYAFKEIHNNIFLREEHYFTPQDAWNMAKEDAVFWSDAFAEAGYHKQVYNRTTEAYQMIRVLVSATETANFYWLRDDKAADPTLAEQARCMREAHLQSKPQLLKAGEWHLPFVKLLHNGEETIYCDADFISDRLGWIPTQIYKLEDAIKVSCARCAATSFRNENYGLEKSLQVYDRLVNGDKVHAGALEHCGTPMQKTYATLSDFMNGDEWEAGVSHMDRDGNLWSGNLKGFVQYRKLVPNECYKGA